LKLMSDKSYERRRLEMFFYKCKEETWKGGSEGL
jgi:hypothetical protein